MVLIHSAKYEYAEIDLRDAFQLVGANGLGKTALISALQYLYVDDQSRMKFGKHKPEETRRFYFPQDNSFVLFECETPLGLVCLGARSLGPTAGHQLERFHWSGGFDRSDFIREDGTAQPWDSVRANLAVKELAILRENAELRRLLGAEEDKHKSTWNLVPLVDARDFKRFQTSFQRLLQLRDLSQNDLKDLLADCAKLADPQREVDLMKDFQRELAEIHRDHLELQLLDASAQDVRKLRSAVVEESQTRAFAHAAVGLMHERLRTFQQDWQRHFDALSDVRASEEKKLEDIKRQRTTLLAERSQLDREIGKASETINALKTGREEFDAFLPDLEIQALEQVRATVSELRERLRQIPAASPDELRERITNQEQELKRRNHLLANAERMFLNWLREHLGKEETHQLASLVHPHVLTSVLDEQVDVRNPERVLARLRQIVEATDACGLNHPDLRLDFTPGAARDAERALSPEKAAADVKEAQDRLNRLKRDLETVLKTQELRIELKAREREEDERRERIQRYRRHQELLEGEPALLESFGKFQRHKQALDDQMDSLDNQRTEATRQRDSAFRKMEEWAARQREIELERRNLPTAPGEATEPTAWLLEQVRTLPMDMLALIQRAREVCKEAATLGASIEERSAGLDQRFAGASFPYDTSAPITARLDAVEAELTSLEDRRHATQNRWTSVLVGARSGFARILDSLNQIKKKQTQLNREFAKMEFSSIASVKLEVVENPLAVDEYSRHAKDTRQPTLFDSLSEVDAHMRQFKEMLERRPRLVLNDLFSIRCQVTRRDGKLNTYQDFDQVESTGTTIVLKVVLNLLVLRDLLVPGKARIPYYLDEVHALDRQNFGNILHLSERLGFIGIYAAPTTAVGPRKFVHLVPNTRGRLVVTPAHVKEILRAPQEAGNG